MLSGSKTLAVTALAIGRRELLALAAAAGLAAPATAAESSRARLGQQLVATMGLGAATRLVAEQGQADVMASIDARISDDFRAGRTLTLDGFVIAKSEAALWLRAAGVRPA